MTEIPFDPDFDKPPKDLWSSFSPKTAFVTGVAAAVLGFGTIGFVVLLFLIIG